MSVITFSLAGIPFDTFEVPEEWEHGHDVQMAIAKFIDETGRPTKHVHMMGAFPGQTQWAGELYGSDALDRSYLFDAICVQQQEVDWIFGPLKYTVAIKSYKGKVFHQNLVRYTMVLEIVEDQNGSAQSVSQTAQMDALIQQTYNQATDSVAAIPPGIVDAPVMIAHDNLTKTVQGLQPLQFASPADLQGLVNQVNAFNVQVQQYLAPLQSNKLTGAALQGFLSLTNALNAYTVFATNLGAIAGSPTQSPVSELFAAGTSLFAVAARYYPGNDIPSVAQAIQTANGLATLFLDSPQKLTIPAVFR